MPNRVPLKYRQLKEQGASPVEVYIHVFNDTQGPTAYSIVSDLFDIEEGSEQLRTIRSEAFSILFKDYVVLRDEGKPAEVVARIARNNGLIELKRMLMILFVFNCSFAEMKKAIVLGDDLADSFEEYQERIADALEEAFRLAEQEDELND